MSTDITPLEDGNIPSYLQKLKLDDPDFHHELLDSFFKLLNKHLYEYLTHHKGT